MKITREEVDRVLAPVSADIRVVIEQAFAGRAAAQFAVGTMVRRAKAKVNLKCETCGGEEHPHGGPDCPDCGR